MATTPLSPGFYTRYGNPTNHALEAAVASLEGAERALATASGMGALTAAILSVVQHGDHIVAQQAMYGGTSAWLSKIAPQLGLDVTLVDQTVPDSFRSALRARTRLFLLETPSNPLLTVTDLRAVVAIAREAEVTTLVDNTVASPVNQRPLEFGVDLVVHSATKYLGGHGDLSAGLVVGPASAIERVWQRSHLLGSTLDPFAGWLCLRGLRTLPMRVGHQNQTALEVAHFLERTPTIEAVYYPGLESHPQHALAKEQMQGFGGLLSFDVSGGYDAARDFMSRLKLARRSASFGSFSTLAVHPASMWSADIGEGALAKAGVRAGLVRLAVGFESASAICSDLHEALLA
jgi:methionine-gamma-lyase